MITFHSRKKKYYSVQNINIKQPAKEVNTQAVNTQHINTNDDIHTICHVDLEVLNDILLQRHTLHAGLKSTWHVT